MTVTRSRRTTAAKTIQREIAGEIKDMPVDALIALREFAAFLRHRMIHEGSPALAALTALHPTVDASSDTLLGLMDILPAIGGDALADSEALYD